jgi:hypothetical protein
MKDKYRAQLESLYGGLYHKHLEGDPFECFYCGDTRTCLDHRPALSVLDVSGPKYMRKNKIPLVLVRSCSSCNSMLNNKPFLTVLEATEWLRDKLEELYERSSALWTPKEIAELGYSLRTFIQHKQEQNYLLLNRVRFAQQRSIDYDMMPRFSEYFDNQDYK